MATTNIGMFLTGLAEYLDVMRIAETIFILIVLIKLYKMEKKQPDKGRWVTSVAMGGFLATAAPFALIQAVAAFGLHLLDADWTKLRLTPLDIMFWASIDLLCVMSGKKLFGCDTAMPDESVEGKNHAQ